MNLLTKISQLLTKPISVLEPDILFPGLVTAKQYATFNPEQRMRAVMTVGDAADIKHYSFLK
jgi:hypothetical protein